MATKQQKKELIETLKFTPITVRLMLQGYGGEAYAGIVDRAIYEYFKKNKIDLEEYANDWDNKFNIPSDFQPFAPGSAYECDNLWHASGAELSDINTVVVYNTANGNDIWECSLGWNDLKNCGVSVGEGGGSELDDLEEGTVVYWGGQGEKGCFFDAEFELRAPFDPKKLHITYENCDGWLIVSSVEYNSEDLDGSGGYSTTGKWGENKWIIVGDEEVYEPSISEETTDNEENYKKEINKLKSELDNIFADSDECLQEAADALNDTFTNELESTNKTSEEIMYNYTDWFSADVKPVRKGEYEVERTDKPVWPFGTYSPRCSWTGRSWKDEYGKKVENIARWRGLAENPEEVQLG